jgi:hypothetical protein
VNEERSRDLDKTKEEVKLLEGVIQKIDDHRDRRKLMDQPPGLEMNVGEGEGKKVSDEVHVWTRQIVVS